MTDAPDAQTRKKIDDLIAHNELLARTLKESRDQIIELHAQLEKLGLPPNNFGYFLSSDSDGLINIIFNSRQMRVAVSPEVKLGQLQLGQLVILNDSMNVIATGGFPQSGQLATYIEPTETSNRIIVRGLSQEVHVVHLSDRIEAQTLRPGDNLLCDLKSGFAFEVVSRSEIDDLLLEEVPDISYEDIGGLSDQIERIIDAVELPFLQSKLFTDYRLKAPKGILLYGPPGCGKTLIAKAVANSLANKSAGLSGSDSRKSYFINIKGPELLNKYIGETERQIRTIFQRAKQRAEEGSPVIVFFDEMDALFRTRGTGISSDVETTIVAQLLSEIDGVEGLENVIVIGASNREDMIDPAILRPGRLDVKIRINRPDQEAARQIFSRYLKSDLPIHSDEILKYGTVETAIIEMIQAVVSQMYTHSPENQFLEATYASGEKEILYFADFNSGAMIQNIVARAKKSAIKAELGSGERGIKLEHLLSAATAEFLENEDLPNTTNPDDWAKISGRKGQQIVYLRTLVNNVNGSSARTILSQNP